MGRSAAAAAAAGCPLPGEADLLLAAQLRQQERRRLLQLFIDLDRDNNKKINAADIAQAMKRDGIMLPIAEIERCVW